MLLVSAELPLDVRAAVSITGAIKPYNPEAEAIMVSFENIPSMEYLEGGDPISLNAPRLTVLKDYWSREKLQDLGFDDLMIDEFLTRAWAQESLAMKWAKESRGSSLKRPPEGSVEVAKEFVKRRKVASGSK